MSTLPSNSLGMTRSDIAQFVADCRILIAHSQTLYEVRDALSKAVVLIESNALETCEPRGPSGHVGGCMCSPCREWRLVQYANAQKALEQQPLTTVCQWEPIEEGSRCFNTCKPGEEFNLDDGCEPYPFCHWCGRPVVIP